MNKDETKKTERSFPFTGWLNLSGWAGRTSKLVEVVGETPQRFRIRAIEKTRLSGRLRWLEPGETTLVPRHSITDEPLKELPSPLDDIFKNTAGAPENLRDLFFMAKATEPVFGGLLENDDWKTNEADKDLREMIAQGYVEEVPGQGFVITEKGKELVKAHNLDS